MVEKLFPEPFLKSQNWAYLWINRLKFLYSFFLFYPKLRAIEINWSQTAGHLLVLHITFFYKTKRGLELVFLTYFLHDLKNNISLFTFYYIIKLHCLFILTSWDIGQYAYSNCLLTKLWRHKFLCNQPVFFCMSEKWRQTFKYIWNEKSF